MTPNSHLWAVDILHIVDYIIRYLKLHPVLPSTIYQESVPYLSAWKRRNGVHTSQLLPFRLQSEILRSPVKAAVTVNDSTKYLIPPFQALGHGRTGPCSIVLELRKAVLDFKKSHKHLFNEFVNECIVVLLKWHYNWCASIATAWLSQVYWSLR